MDAGTNSKVVRMFIIIVLIFAVCWLPYHAYFIYTHHHSSVAYTKYVQHLYLAFYWLAMANLSTVYNTSTVPTCHAKFLAAVSVVGTIA
ncbi:hypothetical protein B566_EDAN002661 [Ephemera danica]|nr:hypothetical protein B566_EDAN002661 [Ephemera danica]